GILLRDVAPDSQRSEPVQSRLALAPAPRVAEHGVPGPEHHVGDDLLERGVLLDLRPGAVLHQLGHQQRAQVALGLRRETLESTEPIELGTGDDQDAFVELHGGPSYLSSAVPQLPGRRPFFSPSVDCLCFLGYYPRRGTRSGFSLT